MNMNGKVFCLKDVASLGKREKPGSTLVMNILPLGDSPLRPQHSLRRDYSLRFSFLACLTFSRGAVVHKYARVTPSIYDAHRNLDVKLKNDTSFAIPCEIWEESHTRIFYA